MSNERTGVIFTYTDETERQQSQRLAEARQQLAHEGTGYVPAWDELTDDERDTSTVAARNYLLAAKRAGLVTSAALPAGIDLSDHDTYFVLTTALEDFASEQRHQAANDPDTAKQRTQWATIADRIWERIETA